MSESRLAPPVRVLVADSGTAFKKVAAENLARKGFAIELAHTADDAFEKVRSFKPNLIFYDLETPGYDGFEAITLVGRTHSGKEARLVASSFHTGQDFASKALSAGAWAFLPKPLNAAAILDTALAVKRHLRRPRQLPRSAANPALKVVTLKCVRPSCDTPVAAFLLKPETLVPKADQFETPIYLEAVGAADFVDYNLLSVAVCPECYFAFDAGAPRRRAARSPKSAPPVVSPLPHFKIAADADDTLFSEDRSASAAIVAFRLAIESEKVLASVDSAEELDRLADLAFKAAAVAHLAGDDSLQDRFLAEAEQFLVPALEMEPSAAVYRGAYRLAAVYVFFLRDPDAARVARSFDLFDKPSAGRTRPRDARALQYYREAVTNIIAQRNMNRRSDYLSK